MPGILPMKVIKVGNANTQTRIAQACDRCRYIFSRNRARKARLTLGCRSKKIRCDGLAPQCSQCSTVGFECKTSDKLSRRAFPRGYTESLEDRVRALETEVRELKDLVDEKDEKIDMLSRFYSQSPAVGRKSSLSQLENDRPSAQRLPSQKEETFRIHQPPFLSGEGEDAYFIGPSSGRALIGEREVAIFVLQSFFADMIRLFQEKAAGIWQSSRHTRYCCILPTVRTGSRLACQGIRASRHDSRTSTPPLRPTHQCLLSRVGAAVSDSSSTHVPLSLRAVCLEQ
jgi:hypothetical protein